MVHAYEAKVDWEKAKLYPLIAMQMKKGTYYKYYMVPFHITHGSKQERRYSRIYKIDDGGK